MENENSLVLTPKAKLSELAVIADQIENYCEERDWPLNWSANVNLALDELITNIIHYGNPDGSTPQNIHLTLFEESGSLVVILEDSGIAFDPFSEIAAPSLDTDLMDRPIGGLGVYLVTQLMSEVSYERREGRNRIKLILHSSTR